MNTEIKDTIENRLKVTERLLANLYFFKGNIIQISDTNAPYSEVTHKLKKKPTAQIAHLFFCHHTSPR